MPAIDEIRSCPGPSRKGVRPIQHQNNMKIAPSENRTAAIAMGGKETAANVTATGVPPQIADVSRTMLSEVALSGCELSEESCVIMHFGR